MRRRHAPFHRPRRLYTRIYLHFLGVLALVGLLTGGLYTFHFQGGQGGPWPKLPRMLSRFAAREAGALGRDFADPTARAAALRRLSQDFDLDVTLRDPQGGLLALDGPELPPMSRDEIAALSGGRSRGPQRRGHLFAAAPVPDPAGGAPLGVLEVSMARHVHRGLLRSVLSILLVLMVVAAATAGLARRLARPIERLTEANRRFGGGDLSYRIGLPPGACEPGVGDVDELMRLMGSWNDMAERIENLVRGHKDLLANVSHDLRSPLARIRVALALLPQDREMERRLADVEGDLGELERLIDDVLTTSQLEASGLPRHLERVAVGTLLALLADRAAHTPITAGREVRVQPGPALSLQADGGLLKRALWNLIENAAKYGQPPILLAAERMDGGVALSVTDQGAGIAKADRLRVLQPFYQVDRARTPEIGRGFGLGLTLALRIAEVHGGRLHLGPAEQVGDQERGLRVTLEIPDAA